MKVKISRLHHQVLYGTSLIIIIIHAGTKYIHYIMCNTCRYTCVHEYTHCITCIFILDVPSRCTQLGRKYRSALVLNTFIQMHSRFTLYTH